MNKISFRILLILLTILMVFSMVACKEEIPEPSSYVVTFDSEGGSPVASVTVEEGAKVKKPSEPTKEGYYFGGWWIKNKKGNYSSTYNFSKAVTADLTLYARWWTTKYYMTAGWDQTIPAWSAPDADTVTVPAPVLA